MLQQRSSLSSPLVSRSVPVQSFPGRVFVKCVFGLVLLALLLEGVVMVLMVQKGSPSSNLQSHGLSNVLRREQASFASDNNNQVLEEDAVTSNEVTASLSPTRSIEENQSANVIFEEDARAKDSTMTESMATMEPVDLRDRVESWFDARRNRWVSDSLTYMHTLLKHKGYAKRWAPPQPAEKRAKKVCIAMLLNERALPYEYMLMTSLLQGNDRQSILNDTELHLLNCERRESHSYNRLESLRKLPVVQVHDMPKRRGDPDGNYDKLVFNQFEDYRDALRICYESGAEWTVVLESDAYLVRNFVEILEKVVFDELSDKREETGWIALYDPSPMQIPPEMNFETSQDSAAKLNDIPVNFKLSGSYKCYGNIAKAFPRETLAKALEFVDGEPETAMDSFITCAYLNHYHLKGMVVRPSLVQHSGFRASTHVMVPSHLDYVDHEFVERPQWKSRYQLVHRPDYLGCFQDRGVMRAMSIHAFEIGQAEPDSCIAECRKRDQSFAGIQNGEECWCGDQYQRHGVLSHTDCNMPCKVNAKLFGCGGAYTLSVFSVH